MLRIIIFFEFIGNVFQLNWKIKNFFYLIILFILFILIFQLKAQGFKGLE